MATVTRDHDSTAERDALMGLAVSMSNGDLVGREQCMRLAKDYLRQSLEVMLLQKKIIDMIKKAGQA
jgi:hypothetical protein